MKARLDKHLALTLAAALAVATAAQAADAPGGGQGEGIKVHGQWTIEVRNADGSLASRTEFKNRLALPGDEPYAGVGNRILAGLLGRASSAGLWEIHLHDVNVEICFDPSAPVTHGCVITEAGATNVGANYFRTLAVNADLVNGTVTLRGTARRTSCPGCSTLHITHVGTALRTCGPSVAPSMPCTTTQGGGNFTKTEIASPPGVAFDQSIDITVVLSFS